MGPLHGVRVLEFQGLGPAPFAGMMLADMGAEVISITRNSVAKDGAFENTVSERGKKSIAINLKHPKGIESVLRLCKSANILLEGFRPGVMERLGLGPEDCFDRNPKLIYGRMTGWGQTGPLAQAAGHDINYIALSGALHASGRAGDKPTPAINLVGDFGGGGMFLAFGVLAALHEAKSSQKGQVVDVSMVEGSACLMNMMYSFFNNQSWQWEDQRGVNFLDTGAHFYDSYETFDGKHIAIGAIEPQFYQVLLTKLNIDDPTFNAQMDKSRWPELKEKLNAIFKTRSQAEWTDLLQDCDACFAPVLSMAEAPFHPHNQARKSFVKVGEHLQPGPAPKFSRSVPTTPTPAPRPGADTEDIMLNIAGYSECEVLALEHDGAIPERFEQAKQ